MNNSGLEQLFDEIADRVAARVVMRLKDYDPGMVDQSSSPLGSRRHCRAVSRRLTSGEPGAAKVGRRFLLTKEALGEELGQLSRRGKSATSAAVPGSTTEKLRREIALIRGGRS